MSFDWRYQSELGKERLEEYFTEQISSIFQRHTEDDRNFVENKYILLYYIKSNLKNQSTENDEEFCVRFLVDYSEKKLKEAYRKLLKEHFGSISLYVKNYAIVIG